MKRFLLSAVAAFLTISGFSQSPAIGKVSAAQQSKHISIPARSVENHSSQQASQVPQESFTLNQRSATEVEIGTTYYDLQTNSAIQRRLVKHANGTLTATWTFSPDNSDDFPNRGTGYNYFNGTTWGNAPTTRLETERTGWPNPLVTGQGKEVIISHNTQSSILRQTQRNTVGSGTWTQNNLTSLSSQVWSRAAVGGPNNNTIHLVAMTTPTDGDLGGTPYNGMNGAFLYSRSTDGGSSWGIYDYQIPGTDSAYYEGFDGDSYHMDAQGNTVAIVVGGLGRGVQLYKSVNNGVTWTKTDVLISDIWFNEPTTYIDTSLASRIFTSDGSVNVLIDDNGMCHVWFGTMYIANPDLTDGFITYYPFTNSIDYWNESFVGPYPISLAGALDLNNNQVLDLTNSGGQYRFSGIASHPQASIDEDGCMYVTYDALREDLTNGSQHYRHTYLMSTCDNGCSWSFPIDITGNVSNDFVECVFPSISREADEEIHVIYMADNEPGISVDGDTDPVTVNKIIYLNEETARFQDTIDFCPVELAGDTFLCPGGSVQLHALGCANSYSWSGPGGFSSSSPNITVSTLGTYVCTVNTVCGPQTLTANVVNYSSSGNPFVNVQATLQNMCPGDTATLTALTNIGGVSYQWSANAGSATTQSVDVYATGTFTVTVSDCSSGITVQSIVISQPANVQATIVGDNTICPSETTVLNALPVSGGNYLWSTGSTVSSTSITAAGTYTVTVQNCAGTSIASFAVTEEPLPVAAIDATETEGCEGELLTVTASGGTSYEWSNSTSNASLSINDPSESGTYTVTVTNDCGDTDTEEISLTIHPTPSAPVVTFNGTDYVSSAGSTGTHTWYVNGVAVGNQTGSTLPGSAVGNGKTVYVTYTDENGCVSASSNTLVGIDDINSLNDNINVFPNPSNGRFDVRFDGVSGVVEISVVNTIGQTVYNNRIQVSSGQAELVDLGKAEAGLYLMKIVSTAGTAVETLIIE